MSKPGRFRLDPEGIAAIEGEMTLDTVADLHRQAQAAGRNQARFAGVDLARVSRVDSSGLALLLEWQAARARADGRLAIRNAPRDLLQLAALCGAQELLDLNGRERAYGGE
jgi:phospholipid transport system transporter-binding protein